MPLQIIPQQNQPVGLQLLGDAIHGGATDYANRQLALQDEARKRGYQLADVASNRNYDQQQFDKVRLLQLADEQRRRGEGLTDAQLKAQMENRLRLLTEAEGRGFFDGRQIGNAAAEDAGLQRLQVQLAKESEFSAGQPANAQARLAELGQIEQSITQKMAALEARLSAQPTIDQSAVANAAVQLATQANGGKQPSREQIQASLPDALAAAKSDALTRWYQDKQDAQVQQQILASQLNTIRQQQANLTSTFKVAPTASPLATPPASASIAPPAARGAPMAGFTTALNARLGAANPSPETSTSNGAPGVQNITSALSIAPPAAVPALRQARTSLLADSYAKLEDPLNQTQAQLADVSQKLQRLQSGLNPFQGVTPAPLSADPSAQGELMDKLLMQQQALQRQYQQQQAARTAGKTSLLSGIPAFNTPAGFSPAPQPTPGSVLSDPYAD